MKKRRINLSVSFFFICVFSICAQTRVDALLQKLHNPNSDYVFVVSHRGDWRNAPENSPQAIERCIKMDVDVVEIDIRMTKDSVLVLMHDETIDRTTNGKGNISDYILEELNRFRLKDALGVTLQNQQIPTLKQVLELCKDRILINVDKAEDYMDLVQKLLKETGCESQVVYKGSKPYAEVKKQYGDLLNQIIYMPIIKDSFKDLETYIDDFIRSYHPLAFEVLFKTEDSPMFAQMQKMKANGCRIWVNALWDYMNAGHDDERAAYGDPEGAWGWLIEKGTSIIQTDRPKELVEYLKNKGLHCR